MFHLRLAGIAAALALFVCIQLLVGAAPTHDTVRQLSFADRVAYQRAIEDVYWRHRIWPQSGRERPNPKPSFDAVVSQAAIEQKVKDCLRDAELLEKKWQKPLTAEQLQAEMDRMAQNSKQPEVLREVFAALGNDPFVIAECLARPVLSDRLIANFCADAQESLESWTVTAQGRTPKVMTVVTTSYRLPAIPDHPNECVDEWTATSLTNAPAIRYNHTAVWTGSEMIVWGADSSNTGGRYNPSTDSWTATSTTGAPTSRSFHTAVWSGTEMIVWGGFNGSNQYNTGGRYNPITDSWTATSTANAPLARGWHTAVWSGDEMIVWGGSADSAYLKSGGRYDPTTDRWTATSTVNAPPGRNAHTAVWTGSEMIVFGGQTPGKTNSGGRYNPSTDTWADTAGANVPEARAFHTAVWADGEMIIFGGHGRFEYLNSGGRYNPGTDSWTLISTTNAPSLRQYHKAVWTGSEMIVWGGFFIDDTAHYLDTGGRYDPASDSWTDTSLVNAPTGRWAHTAVWTGSEMIIWGGRNDTTVNTGGGYCGRTAPIALEGRARRQGGKHVVVLTWSPADGGSVNILRDGVVVGATEDDGEAQDRLGNHTGVFTYQVCATDSGECSNEVEVRVEGSDD